MSYELESISRFLNGKKLTGVEKLDGIIKNFRLGQWFDHEGYEDQGLTLMKSAIDEGIKLPASDREIIADILWPET